MQCSLRNDKNALFLRCPYEVISILVLATQPTLFVLSSFIPSLVSILESVSKCQFPFEESFVFFVSEKECMTFNTQNDILIRDLSFIFLSTTFPESVTLHPF